MIVSQPGILSSRRRSFTSPYDWTSRTSGSTDDFRGVVWNANESMWAAVTAEGGGAGDLIASADAITWNTEENNLNSLRDICTDGTTYCAVGDSAYMLTATDPTGAWTSRTSSFGADSIAGCHFANAVWLAMGNAGKIATAASATGTWTQRTSNFGASQVRSGGWDGTHWVIVGDGGKLATSTNAVTTAFTINGSANFGATFIRYVCYSSDLSTWVAVGSSGKIGYNTGLATGAWTQAPSPFGGGSIITTVQWDTTEKLFVAVSNASEIAISEDGINWHLDAGGFADMWDLSYGDGFLVVVGNSGAVKTSFS